MYPRLTHTDDECWHRDPCYQCRFEYFLWRRFLWSQSAWQRLLHREIWITLRLRKRHIPF